MTRSETMKRADTKVLCLCGITEELLVTPTIALAAIKAISMGIGARLTSEEVPKQYSRLLIRLWGKHLVGDEALALTKESTKYLEDSLK